MGVEEVAAAVAAGPNTFVDGDGHTYLFGPEVYTPGKIPLTRWFVSDGAGRIYPLSERYRQRVESFVLWPVRRLIRWKQNRSTRVGRP